MPAQSMAAQGISPCEGWLSLGPGTPLRNRPEWKAKQPYVSPTVGTRRGALKMLVIVRSTPSKAACQIICPR